MIECATGRLTHIILNILLKICGEVRRNKNLSHFLNYQKGQAMKSASYKKVTNLDAHFTSQLYGLI
jgi:hypothetical protein